jgi:DNA-binding MarR family transcriptional regulator
MDPLLLDLIVTDITSLGRWDALRYFLETGEERATMDDIGVAVGRDSTALLGILGELTALGWLSRRTNEAGQTEYVLTQEQGRRMLLDQLRAALHDREFCIQALYYWTRGAGL